MSDEIEVNPNAKDGVAVIPGADGVWPSSGDGEATENNLNDDGSVKSGASLDHLPEVPSGSED